MNHASPQPATDDQSSSNVVGNRVLTGLQLIDISRLSAHPIPFVNQGLITVAGQGPKDSNGAGKSSLIAAISLLHADEQWRLTTGAADAAELLFTAEVAAQEAQWSNADRGYIIGVFTDPTASEQPALNTSALTVWLRINRKAPYVDLRWIHRLHVPAGASDDERAHRADTLWEELPRSNGRSDFHANRLASVLYGEDVRCVSFLSTSVRASQTANLLAQPLNDLNPERIFDAVAALTGLDKELDSEQRLRTAEHTHHVAVGEAERDLQQWERHIAAVEDGIVHRKRARELLGTASGVWQSRCAAYLVNGLTRHGDITDELARTATRRQEAQAKLDKVKEELRTQRDDSAFEKRTQERIEHYQRLAAQDSDLKVNTATTAERIEGMTNNLRQQQDKALLADGRSVAQAHTEEREAFAQWEKTLGAKGVAEAGVRAADSALKAAESGDDVAVLQRKLLRQQGITALALRDALHLNEAERRTWEPRLELYRDALVVSSDDLNDAYKALKDHAGTVLIAADHQPTASQVGLPGGSDPQLTINQFLASLAARAGIQPEHVDLAAGVTIVDGYPQPLTGRASRITVARLALEHASATLADAVEDCDDAARKLQFARDRIAGAQAAEAATVLESQIAKQREELGEFQRRRDLLTPLLAEAYGHYATALGDRSAREQTIAALRSQSKTLDEQLGVIGEQESRLVAERQRLDLPSRHTAWGETEDAARIHLLSLPDDQQLRTTADWDQDAADQLSALVRLCFPESTPADQLPAEVRELVHTQRWNLGGVETRIKLAQPMLRAMRMHLSQTEQQDKFDERQITDQRTQRSKDLAAAEQGLAEASHAAAVHRSSLAAGIKATLKRVSDEFDRLDQSYGGYGAGLDYPEPEPPTQPDRPWRWAVTPKWRRAESHRMAPYRLRGNTALMDEKAVKLVCAAALANSTDRPLLLVLDELGRNLGKEHRREAVALFEKIGQDRNITVVGALQDDMERYAINASGLYIKLRRSSDTHPYNDAPVIAGNDSNHPRVEMLQDWLSSYRAEPQPGDEPQA